MPPIIQRRIHGFETFGVGGEICFGDRVCVSEGLD